MSHRKTAAIIGAGVITLLKPAAAAPSSPFVIREDLPRWSVRNGITFALQPDSLRRGFGAPRGLFRVGRPLRPGATEPELLNFIAVEPVTMDGRRGFSELENSPSDGKQGIIYRCERVVETKDTLRLTIRGERFANGAHPWFVVELNAKRPDEVRFDVFSEPGSAPMKMCILTATMGNYQRLRVLQLKDRKVTTAEALPDDPGDGFTRHAVFALKELKRDKSGAIVLAKSDEKDSRTASTTMPKGFFWAYTGLNFTQYWRQPEPVDRDLRAVVNARKVYWGGTYPIPGGKAFENFELNAAFYEGQVFVFGVKK